MNTPHKSQWEKLNTQVGKYNLLYPANITSQGLNQADPKSLYFDTRNDTMFNRFGWREVSEKPISQSYFMYMWQCIIHSNKTLSALSIHSRAYLKTQVNLTDNKDSNKPSLLD